MVGGGNEAWSCIWIDVLRIFLRICWLFWGVTGRCITSLHTRCTVEVRRCPAERVEQQFFYPVEPVDAYEEGYNERHLLKTTSWELPTDMVPKCPPASHPLTRQLVLILPTPGSLSSHSNQWPKRSTVLADKARLKKKGSNRRVHFPSQHWWWKSWHPCSGTSIPMYLDVVRSDGPWSYWQQCSISPNRPSPLQSGLSEKRMSEITFYTSGAHNFIEFTGASFYSFSSLSHQNVAC